MEENLLTHSDSKMAGKVTVFLEQTGKKKTVDIGVLVFRNIKDGLYYISLINIGQLASGETMQEAFECAYAMIKIVNQPEYSDYKLPKTPNFFIKEYLKLTSKKVKVDVPKDLVKSKLSKRMKPKFELMTA